MTHQATTCVQCGATDDHPKYVGEQIWHHDCLPAALRADLALNTEHGAAILKAADSGTHGDKLRTHIEKLHNTKEA